MADCQTCRNWRNCTHDCLWFSYSDIRWCPLQVLWIIAHKEEIGDGRWPKEPYSSANGGQRTIKTEAGFVKPELILAELEVRLAKTPNKGEILVTQVEDGRDLGSLSIGAREICMYVKGQPRKNTGFKRWLREVFYG